MSGWIRVDACGPRVGAEEQAGLGVGEDLAKPVVSSSAQPYADVAVAPASR